MSSDSSTSHLQLDPWGKQWSSDCRDIELKGNTRGARSREINEPELKNWKKRLLSDVTVKFEEIDGLETRVLYSGESHAANVLILHGLGTSADFLWRTIAYLGENFHVCCPDLIGHGFTASDSPWNTPPQTRMLRHIRALCASLGWSSYSMVGSSYGSHLASIMALESPESVEKLVLIGDMFSCYTPEGLGAALARLRENASIAWDAPTVENCLRRLQNTHFRDDSVPPELPLIQATIYSTPGRRESYFDILDGLTDLDGWDEYWTQDRIASVEIPTLRIEGQEDPRVSTGPLRLIAQQSKDCEMILLKECGHQPYIEQSDVVNSICSAFLQGLPMETVVGSLDGSISERLASGEKI